jgi:hypothetical protein
MDRHEHSGRCSPCRLWVGTGTPEDPRRVCNLPADHEVHATTAPAPSYPGVSTPTGPTPGPETPPCEKPACAQINAWYVQAETRARAAEAEIARIAAGSEPVAEPNVEPTPGQAWTRLLALDVDKRLTALGRMQASARDGADCFLRNHNARLEELATARRESEETVERWRARAVKAEAEIARWETDFPCTGCNYDDGPVETCPRHGREYAYWVDGCTELSARCEAQRERIDRVRALCDELHDTDEIVTEAYDRLRAAIEGDRQ